MAVGYFGFFFTRLSPDKSLVLQYMNLPHNLRYHFAHCLHLFCIISLCLLGIAPLTSSCFEGSFQLKSIRTLFWQWQSLHRTADQGWRVLGTLLILFNKACISSSVEVQTWVESRQSCFHFVWSFSSNISNAIGWSVRFHVYRQAGSLKSLLACKFGLCTKSQVAGYLSRGSCFYLGTEEMRWGGGHT